MTTAVFLAVVLGVAVGQVVGQLAALMLIHHLQKK